jgi:hypothetical protein
MGGVRATVPEAIAVTPLGVSARDHNVERQDQSTPMNSSDMEIPKARATRSMVERRGSTSSRSSQASVWRLVYDLACRVTVAPT